MNSSKTNSFSATIEIIGINPFVYVPDNVLKNVFAEAKKDRGKIPVKMKINGFGFTQTLIKYSGHWRLYLNTPMRKAANKEVGDTADFELAFDPVKREVLMHPAFIAALEENKDAKDIFDGLRPSLQLEINKYLSFLKTEESVNKNIIKAVNFLLGKERFIGRDNP